MIGTSKAARLVIDAFKLADNVIGEALTVMGRFADEAMQLIGTKSTTIGITIAAFYYFSLTDQVGDA